MNTPWYDDKKEIERHIRQGGLAGLNVVVDARSDAHYNRKETLKEFFLIGHFWADTCGNLWIIQWETKLPNATSPFSVFPLVATREEWNRFVAEREIQTPTSSLSGNPPPYFAHCDICNTPWTIEDCHLAVAIRNDGRIPLEEYMGLTIEDAEGRLKAQKKTTVFFAGTGIIYNPKYAGMSSHPVYHDLRVDEKGWVQELDKAAYRIQSGDMGYAYMVFYRHPACHQKHLEQSEREYLPRPSRRRAAPKQNEPGTQ